jgi:sulfide:quinone oxidoreductase
MRAGSVVFTMPPEPAPCAATALKPLFMACDHWRRTGALSKLEVRLVLPGPTAVGLSEADEILEGVLASYGIEVLREARVTSVDLDARGITVASPAGLRLLEGVSFAHVVPHYRAPSWIAESGLAIPSASGLVDIDPGTLRHRRHRSVWALGDAASVETRPSGGALRHQVDILSHNLAASASGDPLRRYDGYTVMPITVDRRKLMLLEVDRDGRPAPSVPFPDLTRPRRSTWLLDRYALPVTYFRRILRGKI